VDGASVPVDRQYTWGLCDRWDLLRRKRSTTGSLDETLFLLRDYLDSVAVVDDSGAVVERYAYDAFGNVRFLAPDYTGRSGSDFDWEFFSMPSSATWTASSITMDAAITMHDSAGG